jgi:hypothetical protein
MLPLGKIRWDESTQFEFNGSKGTVYLAPASYAPRVADPIQLTLYFDDNRNCLVMMLDGMRRGEISAQDMIAMLKSFKRAGEPGPAGVPGSRGG